MVGMKERIFGIMMISKDHSQQPCLCVCADHGIIWEFEATTNNWTGWEVWQCVDDSQKEESTGCEQALGTMGGLKR